VRLFAAVWPTDEVRAVLEALPRPPTTGVRWTTGAQWHVTLAFFGEQPPEAVPDLARVVAEAATALAPLRAVAGPATARLGPGVLCLPVDGLEAAAAAVRRGVAGLTVGPDPHPFSGHLTLARAPRRNRVPARLAGVPVAASWTVDALALVSSVLDPGGARYETLVSAPLSRQGPP